MPSAALAGVRCRQITDSDLPAVADLLSRGFRFRPKSYWLRGLRRQANRPRPENHPTYGYLLESAHAPVGAILMFFTEVKSQETNTLRCNLSSWYIEPNFRIYGTLLVTSAIKDKSVTYFNVSPSPVTWPIVEAQGFSVYCRGEVYAFPALSRQVKQTRIEVFVEGFSESNLPESDLLKQHAGLGCLSLVLNNNGENHPFIFQRRRAMKRLLPCYRLIYCRDIQDFIRFAGNLGRFLLARGTPLVVVDANGRIPGLVGHYTERYGRKYAKGPHIPKLGDLAFTEGVFFNF
jgi:hypothetical protein